MYRILVVDDEPFVRLTIKSIADWQQYGFEIACEASDGLDAFEKAENGVEFDILLTDISMPRMNGIELIKAIRGMDENIPVIVLSAYNEYNFVREAFKLGAVDYVLKSDITAKSMLKLFEKAADFIRDRKQIRNDEKIRKDIMRNKLVNDLIKGINLSNAGNLANKCDLRISSKNITVLVFRIDGYSLLEENHDYVVLSNLNNSILNIMNQKRNEFNIGEIISISSREYVYIMSFENHNSFLEIERKVNTIAGSIRYTLSEYLNISATVGLSSIENGYENIPNLYRRALEAASLRLIYGKGRIINQNDLNALPDTCENRLYDRGRHLVNALENSDRSLLEKELHNFFSFVEGQNLTDINMAYSLYIQIIYIVVNYLNEKGIKIDEVFGGNINFYDKIARLETINDMNNWVSNIMFYLFNEIAERNSSKSHKLKKAIDFIKNNYTDNINLKIVSDYVEVSDAYLSRIFTREMNESFISYVTRLRLDKAKKLMKETNLSLYEISERVGYENQEHFSRVFKKYVGVSPSRYRNE